MLALLMSVSGVIAQEQGLQSPQSSIGTAFTYQGQLKSASGPITGNCDFQFSLWDSLANATGQIGTTQSKSSVALSNGLFTVQLDFGANAFNGEARWLEIAVRCPAGSGNYATLSPRQPLTPAPYSLYSANTDTLDGQHASAFQQHTQNLMVVAKSGGDFTTITDALNSITTASATNPFTIYVAPGIYSERVVMKPYVDIEGAGELATRITYTGSGSYNTGTVIGASNAELRFLTVENTGGNSYADAIYNNASSPRLTHVTASASGGTDSNYGVINGFSSSPAMTNVSATASGATYNCGVINEYSSSPTMTNVSATASGGTHNYGVYNSSSSPAMMNVSATASGGTNNYGMWNDSSSPTIQNSVISALGTVGFVPNDGLHNVASSGSYTVTINNSQITGNTSTIYQDSHYTTRLGASQLIGSGVQGSGSYICAFSYTGSYATLSSSCH